MLDVDCGGRKAVNRDFAELLGYEALDVYKWAGVRVLPLLKRIICSCNICILSRTTHLLPTPLDIPLYNNLRTDYHNAKLERLALGRTGSCLGEQCLRQEGEDLIGNCIVWRAGLTARIQGPRNSSQRGGCFTSNFLRGI